MKLTKFLVLGASSIAMLAGAPAMAQDAAEDADERTLTTVTVTGSFIKGTPEDAALPVDVLSAGDLKLEGNPSITELIRNLGVSSGVDGQTNQFASNNLEGTSNVNLRGLGPARTLVLINGQRQTYSPRAIGEQAQLFVDTNMIPSAAIARIEVLKDGAAALYGSDAIAGVVNFITNEDLDGLTLGGDFTTYDGTDGEYNLSAAYGLQFGNGSWVTSVGYSFQNEVPLLEKDWAIKSLAENPVGGFSSLSNPGRYVPLGITPGGIAPLAANVNDNGCEAAGGVLAPTCRFQFTQFDNLVEETERLQIFSEYNHDFGGVELHIEALYATTEVPEWKTSPSYPPQVLTTQVVPISSPGFQQYIADNPNDFPAGTIAALYIGRIFGWGGNPLTGGAAEGSREAETIRLGAGLEGEFGNGMSWTTDLTYSTAESDSSTSDAYVAGLTAALNGFGVCADAGTGAVPTGAVAGQGGCEYYNPFSNAIATNAITGAANPNYVPGLENSVALADWLIDPLRTVNTTELLVWDGVISGDSGFSVGGGTVGFAVGAQVRQEGYQVEADDRNNCAVNPGPGNTGLFSFLACSNEYDEDQTIYAVFGEAQVPLTDAIDVQLALRYEDYGGETGSTVDPKIAAKWQVSDAVALRGSFQTSFRGPTLNQLNGNATTLQFVAPTSAFKAVDQFGNAELDPESATSFNLGGLFDNGNGFTASVDYYNFDFSDPIIVEDQAAIVAAAVGALGTADIADDQILSRITFTDNNNDGIDTANEIARITTNVVNGPDIKTSGVDVRAEQVFENFTGGGGDLMLSVDATYVFEYDVDDFDIEGAAIPGGDRIGQFNRSNFSRSLPQWKANATLNYSIGAHNMRGVVRHVDSYTDERGELAPGSGTIDAQTTLDLFYNYSVDDWGLDLGAGVVNVFDTDPPFAAFDLGYDPYTHNPFGRTFKISVSKAFTTN